MEMKAANRRLFWRCRNTVIGYQANFQIALMDEMDERLWLLLGGDR